MASDWHTVDTQQTVAIIITCIIEGDSPFNTQDLLLVFSCVLSLKIKVFVEQNLGKL